MRYYSCETEIAKDDRNVSIYCRATIRVENTDESDAREYDTFPDGGTWCGACTSYHCAAHASKTHRLTCAHDSRLGFGRLEDMISLSWGRSETQAGAISGTPRNDEGTALTSGAFGSLISK